jgi:hypothetical protein
VALDVASRDNDFCGLQTHDGHREILVDSRSEVAACPLEFGKDFGKTVPEQQSSGGKVAHLGERNVKFQIEDADGRNLIGQYAVRGCWCFEISCFVVLAA